MHEPCARPAPRRPQHRPVSAAGTRPGILDGRESRAFDLGHERDVELGRSCARPRPRSLRGEPVTGVPFDREDADAARPRSIRSGSMRCRTCAALALHAQRMTAQCRRSFRMGALGYVTRRAENAPSAPRRPAGAHRLQVPADERVDVVFLALRQRARLVADRVDALLLPLADVPVLLVGEVPERQQAVELRSPRLRARPRARASSRARASLRGPAGSRRVATAWSQLACTQKLGRLRMRSTPTSASW